MTEVHTTEVTLEEWARHDLVTILELLGFKVEGGILEGEITCEPIEETKVVKITQTIEGIALSTGGEVNDLEQGKASGLGLIGEDDAEEKLKEEWEVCRWRKAQVQARLWSQGREPEQVEGIRFQKIWRIPEAEYRVHSLRDILIEQGARHTGKRLEGVVGFDWQKDWVVVVQTVLVSECSVSGTSE